MNCRPISASVRRAQPIALLVVLALLLGACGSSEPGVPVASGEGASLPTLPPVGVRHPDRFDGSGCARTSSGSDCSSRATDIDRNRAGVAEADWRVLAGFVGTRWTTVLGGTTAVLTDTVTEGSSPDGWWVGRGLVRNDATIAVGAVEVEATLYDHNGSALGTVGGPTALPVLRPGEPVAFEVVADPASFRPFEPESSSTTTVVLSPPTVVTTTSVPEVTTTSPLPPSSTIAPPTEPADPTTTTSSDAGPVSTVTTRTDAGPSLTDGTVDAAPSPPPTPAADDSLVPTDPAPTVRSTPEVSAADTPPSDARPDDAASAVVGARGVRPGDVATVEWTVVVTDASAASAERDVELGVHWQRGTTDPRPVDMYLFQDPPEGERPFVVFAGVTNVGTEPIAPVRVLGAWIDADGRVLEVETATVARPEGADPDLQALRTAPTALEPGEGADVLLVVPTPTGALDDARLMLWGWGG